MKLTEHPDYIIWKSARQRCLNPKHHSYPNYGARGIKFCKRWNDFKKFILDMGPRPTKNHSLDRINNEGDYKPSNCRWATKSEQRNNCRTSYACYNGHKWTKSNTMWTSNGEGKCRRCRICYEKRIVNYVRPNPPTGAIVRE